MIQALGLLLVSYLIGSMPTGLLVVRLLSGKDIRTIESGRTGGTNAMRAAGFSAGLITAVIDILKATLTVWLVRWFLPPVPAGAWQGWYYLVEVVAPLLAILGHNYSIFLIERSDAGRLRLRGGAGGAPSVGGAMGLWAPSILIILPIGLIFLYFVGYASLATISVSVASTLLFAYLAIIGKFSWVYILYGVGATALVAWSLRPNIKRLLAGTERLVGYRARKSKQQAKKEE
jgi:glycerol-3-phosphate acyltransferase PlsY